jgi:hypothetical protein
LAASLAERRHLRRTGATVQRRLAANHWSSCAVTSVAMLMRLKTTVGTPLDVAPTLRRGRIGAPVAPIRR